MKVEEFGFVHRLRVRWAEADIQGVVFNANYLLYCDVAITEYLRALAQGEAGFLREIFDRLYVKKTTLEFFAPARFDEEIDVGVRTEKIGNSSLIIGFGIFRQGQLLLTAQTVYVYAIDGVPKTIPQAFRDRCAQIDKLHITLGSWADLKDRASAVRMQVFVNEQKIPADIELDEHDPVSVHCLAVLGGQVIGTGRLLPEGRVGRMAVLAQARGRSVGSAILEALVKQARDDGMEELELSAQQRAVPFYLRHGFEAIGGPYDEVGIPHQKMRRLLK
jgi:YbgC/YbaW family acyl-CoA thioester hydrolase